MKPALDDLDLRIMDLLQADARAAYVKLAQEVGVSDTTIRARVERMVSRYGLKFVVDIDPTLLGLLYLYLALRVQGPTLAKTIERLSGLEEVIFLARTTGGYDVMAEVVCRDMEALMNFLDDVRAIPGVTHMDVFTVLRTEKEEWRFSGLARTRQLTRPPIGSPTPKPS
jgi:Lrp/AsnC family transcriptional regulator, regulator for asnA, asnC and gidA